MVILVVLVLDLGDVYDLLHFLNWFVLCRNDLLLQYIMSNVGIAYLHIHNNPLI